jgi:hypothetical protein
LEIDANGVMINTTYGVGKEDGFQDELYFKELLDSTGFKQIEEMYTDGHIYQCWENQGHN